jgi:hypothetical protein
VTDARAALAELTALLSRHFGDRLLGLYLFGSLASGGFVPGKSDLDLFAVLEGDVPDIEPLRALHAGFVADRRAWTERVEVGYVPRAVLQTLDGEPAGRIAVISPGEPLNVKDVGHDWTLNWHGVTTAGETTAGETIVGPPPLELGPAITPDAYRRAIVAQLETWTHEARAAQVAYVPAHQGYIVVTLCRALYGLETGEQTTKENAVAWVAERYPERAAFVREALERYRADLTREHEAVIRFADDALAEARRLRR